MVAHDPPSNTWLMLWEGVGVTHGGGATPGALGVVSRPPATSHSPRVGWGGIRKGWDLIENEHFNLRVKSFMAIHWPLINELINILIY